MEVGRRWAQLRLWIIGNRDQLTITGFLLFSMLGSGVTFSILSPGLTFWATSFGTDLNGISGVFTWRSAGYVVGCLFGCVLFRFMNRQICLSLMYFMVALTLALANIVPSLVAVFALLGVNGFCTGVADAATHVIVCQVWKDKSGPYVQALHFAFAIGSTFAHVMSAQFLTQNSFQIPMFICSGLVLVSSILLISLVFLIKDEQFDEDEDDTRTIESSFELLNWLKNKDNQRTLVVVTFSAMIILSYSGMEIVYWELLNPYLQKVPGLEITPEKATYMQASVHSALTASRGLGILLVAKISPLKVVYGDFMMVIIGCVGLLVTNSLWMIWLGNILIGISFATIYPQIYAIVAKEIQVTNFYSSIFVFSSGLTSVYYPQLVSSQISQNHNFLIWLVLVSILASAIFLLVMNLLLKNVFRRQDRRIGRRNSDLSMQELSRL